MIGNFNFTKEIWEDYNEYIEVRFFDKIGIWFASENFDSDSGAGDIVEYIKDKKLEVDKFEIVHLTEIKHEWVHVDKIREM